MREIKFKVWDSALKQIIYPEFLELNKDGEVCYTYDTGRDLEDGDPNKEAILMQYTGSKDAYGREIYEHDIIDIPCDCDSEYGCSHGSDRHEVVWDGEAAAFGLRQIYSDRIYAFDEFGEENLHLIGNRYENPDHLEAN